MSLNIDFPNFNHPEVRVFYEHDLSIPKETVAQILQLPRDTLIEDMESILMDVIHRDEFFRSFDDKDRWLSFNFHALWVLVELKAVEAFPTLLKLLKQDDDFTSYWWVDYSTEDLWEIYYHLTSDKLEELKEILLAPGYWVCRILPPRVAEQIFLYHPERQQEVLTWYHSVLDAFLEMEEEDEALDADLISSMIGSLIGIQGDEFLPKIRALYERGLIYNGFVGDLESIEAAIKNPKHRDRKRALKESIYDRYQDAMNWHGYQMKYNEDYQKQYSAKRSSSSLPARNKPALQSVVREGKKIGRNEPCPCGSGKKYKKCCLA